MGRRLLGFTELGFGLGLHGVEFGLEFPFHFTAHAVDEEDALKVIIFMLDGAGEQAAAGEVQGFAFVVEAADLGRDGAGDIAVDFGEAETSFGAGGRVTE